METQRSNLMGVQGKRTARKSAGSLRGDFYHNFERRIQSGTLVINGINSKLLIRVPFLEEEVNDRLNGNKKVTLHFPAGITKFQLGEVFSTEGLPDLKTDTKGNNITISLKPLSSLPCKVIGDPQILKQELLTTSAIETLGKIPMILVGDDANLELFRNTRWLNEKTSEQPLILGTSFSKLEDPGDILFAIKNHRGSLSVETKEKLILRCANLFKKSDEAEPMDIFNLTFKEIPTALYFGELTTFIEELINDKNTGALIELANSLIDNVKYFADNHEMESLDSNFSSIINELETLGYNNEAKALSKRLLSSEIKNLAHLLVKVNKKLLQFLKKDEKSNKEKVANALKGLEYDENLTADKFKALLPNECENIIKEFIPILMNTKIFDRLLAFSEKDEFCDNLVSIVVLQIFERVKDERVSTGSPEDAVLDRILKDKEFVPTPELMNTFEALSLKKRPYLPAQKIHNKLFLNKYREAENLWKAKKIDEAIKLFEEAHEAHPSHVKTIVYLYFLYTLKSNFEVALGFAKKSLELDPENPRYLNNAGTAYYFLYKNGGRKDIKLLEAAKEHCERSFAINPELTYNLTNLSSIFAEYGDLEKVFYYFNLRNNKERSIGPLLDFIKEMTDLIHEIGLPHKGLDKGLLPICSDTKLLYIVDPVKQKHLLMAAQERVNKGQKPPIIISSDNYEIMFKLVYYAFDMFMAGMKNSAIAILENISETPFKNLADYARGKILFNEGKYGEAANYFSLAMEVDNGIGIMDDFLEKNRPLRLIAADSYVTALFFVDEELVTQNCDELLRRFPSGILYNAVASAFINEKLEKAMEIYSKAMEIEPDVLLPYANLVHIYAEDKKTEEFNSILKKLKMRVDDLLSRGKRAQFNDTKVFLGFLKALLWTEIKNPGPDLTELLQLLEKEFPENFNRILKEFLKENPGFQKELSHHVL